MSKNCVDSIVGIANRLEMPIPLIASRRQIDCTEFGGGYVNGWTTSGFAQYVSSQDKGFVPLCRDHGGPWQGANEDTFDESTAMARAKVSILEDIAAGFDVVHIDPSIRGGTMTSRESLTKIFELYAFVCDTARELGRSIEIEIGAEQQSGHFSEPEELVTLLREVTKFCEHHNYEKPLFCVVQTGTLVREMRNVGLTHGRKNEHYDQKFAVETQEKTIRYLADIAYINGVYIKEHNGDYLSDGSMASRSRLRIGGINIAPELGVYESKCLVSLCSELKLRSLSERMLEIFYDSRKWEKWMSEPSDASDLDRAIIAGHYCFTKPEFLAVKAQIAEAALQKEGIDVNQYLTGNLTAFVRRLLWNAGYFGISDSDAATKGLALPSHDGTWKRDSSLAL